MFALPFRRLNYISKWSPSTIKGKLEGVVFIEKNSVFMIRRNPKGKKYSGEVSTQKFSIRRNINYKSNIIPNIKGEIVEIENGSRIMFRVLPPLPLSIIMIALVVSIFISISNYFFSEEKLILLPLLLFSIIFFFIFFTLIAVEGQIVRKYLEQLLDLKSE
jgi:hypothetical protein